MDNKKWGDWTLNPELMVLDFAYGRHTYQIDLERIDSCAAMLDWIFQVREKGWADAEVMGDLIDAFKAIFDPQKNMCSGGVERIYSRSK